ncbi:ribonuclease domain-containing protein [Planosporangium sp. 12N6]|uniref:ribonuclease domain-containing protein n=1 Tax=Planosporangium spinosum TaxID=3402278 RepID=UPI003CE80FAC
MVALLAALMAAVLVGPAVVAPSQTTPAYATAYSSCTVSGCSAARTARSGWSSRGWPTSRGWYSWSGGQCNFAGGQYKNLEGQLPSGATYYEYDVYPRACGAARDAHRIIVNLSTGATWYSPNHYSDFYRL